MRIQDIFETEVTPEQIDARINTLNSSIKEIEQNIEYADNQTADQNRIRSLQNEIDKLRHQKNLMTGKEIREKIVFSDEIAHRLGINKQLQDMWKGKPGSDYPWRVYHGEAANTIEYAVHGNPEHRHGGASVREIVDFLKKTAAEQ